MSKLTVTIDSHQLTAFKQCEKFFNLTQMQGFESKVEKKGLSIGTLVHKLLANYYQGIKDKKSKKEIIFDTLTILQLSGEIDTETKELLQNKFIEYCAFWHNDNWEIIAVESDVRGVPCPTGFSFLLYEDKNVRMIYEGRIDLVIKIQGNLSFVDHKTQAFKYEINERDDQFLAYAFILGAKIGILNIIGLQKSLEAKDCFRRDILSYSKAELRHWKEETIEWIFRLIQTGIRNKWIQNRVSCKTTYGPCIFKKLCNQTNPEAIESMLQNNFQKRGEVWKAW